MYADTVTRSMQQAIDETNRRRDLQLAYNEKHGIDPTPLRKKIGDITAMLAREARDTDAMLESGSRPEPTTAIAFSKRGIGHEGADALSALIQELNEQMLAAAADLKFELAARLRDEVAELKKQLRALDQAGHG